MVIFAVRSFKARDNHNQLNCSKVLNNKTGRSEKMLLIETYLWDCLSRDRAPLKSLELQNNV